MRSFRAWNNRWWSAPRFPEPWSTAILPPIGRTAAAGSCRCRETGFRIRARIPLPRWRPQGGRPDQARAGRAGRGAVFWRRFLLARPMPHKPGYAVAELVCNPSREIVKDCWTVKKWWQAALAAPLVTLLPFRIGGAAALLGLAGWVAAALLGLLKKPRAGAASITATGRRRTCFVRTRRPAGDQAAPRRADSPCRASPSSSRAPSRQCSKCSGGGSARP